MPSLAAMPPFVLAACLGVPPLLCLEVHYLQEWGQEKALVPTPGCVRHLPFPSEVCYSGIQRPHGGSEGLTQLKPAGRRPAVGKLDGGRTELPKQRAPETGLDSGAWDSSSGVGHSCGLRCGRAGGVAHQGCRATTSSSIGISPVLIGRSVVIRLISC